MSDLPGNSDSWKYDISIVAKHDLIQRVQSSIQSQQVNAQIIDEDDFDGTTVEGEFITFCMFGCEYLDGKLAAMVAQARDCNTDMLIFGGQAPSVDMDSLVCNKRYYGVFRGANLLGKMMQAGDFIPRITCCLFSSSFIADNGLSLDNDLLDPGPLMVLEAMALSQRTCCTDEVVVRSDDWPGYDRLQMLLSLNKTIEKATDFAISTGMFDDRGFRRSLAQAFSALSCEMTRIATGLEFNFVHDLIADMEPHEGMVFCERCNILPYHLADNEIRDRDARISQLEQEAVELRYVIKTGKAKQLASSVKYRFGVKRSALHAVVKPILKIAKAKRASNDQAKAEAARQASGLNTEPRDVKVIVSMTTYPDRIDTVYKTIESVFAQKVKADEVLLWLSRDQFPMQENDLPKSLLNLIPRGLTLKWCDGDIKSHKRYFYTMQERPDDAVILFDDDLLYSDTHIEKMYDSFLKHPKAVSAMRTHRILFDDNGNIRPYSDWEMECTKYIGIERMDLFATEGAGTLWPPHLIPDIAFDLDKIMELAPTSDDIWLKFMQVINDVPVVLATLSCALEFLPNLQDLAALWTINRLSSGNNTAIDNLIREYNEIHGPDDTLIDRMRRDSE